MLTQRKDHVAAAEPVSDAPFLAPAPRGWWTVAAWWAVMEADAFAMTPDPLGTIREGDELLRARADARGVPVVFVPACRAMRAEGVALERAYPRRLLEEAYPTNP